MINRCAAVALVLVLQIPVFVQGQSTPATSKASSNEPITLEFGNMKSEKPALLKQAEYLKSISADSGTINYATQFVEMMQIAKRVGAQNLSQSETDLLISVPEPSEDAMASYFAQKEQARQRVQERTAAVDAAVAKWRAAKAEEAKLEEEKRQADAKAKIEQEKVNAMHRQAAAQERLARTHAAQTELMYRLNRY